MRYWKACCIAISMFSKLPMPQLRWEEEDMKYMMIFFPVVGLLIGGVLYGWMLLAQSTAMNPAMYVLIGAALPIMISGGIHVDGYMDTMDALHSYQSRERKLEILKDPHIGAFAVIYLLIYYLLYIGAFAQLQKPEELLLLAGCFYLSRIGSAICAMLLPKAKKDGLLHNFAATADTKLVLVALSAQLVLCGWWLISIQPLTGSMVLLSNGLSLLYYRRMTAKQFGGTTGDTAGFAAMLCELISVLAIAVMHLV